MTEPTEEKVQDKETPEQAEASFEAGFEKIRHPEKEPEKPKPEEKPAPEETPTAEAAPEQGAAKEGEAKEDAAKAPSPEEWRTVLEGRVVAAERMAREAAGRASALQSALDSAKAQAASRGGEAPSDKEVKAALSNPGAWKQLKEDFPDWAGPVEAEFTALRAEIQKKSPVDLDGLRRELSSNFNQAVALAEERAIVRMKHPDWKTTVNTPEFKAWALSGGPSEQEFRGYKQLEVLDPLKAHQMRGDFAMKHPQWWADKGASIFGEASEDAVKLLDQYADHRKKSVEAMRLKKEKRLEQAVTPKGTSQPPSTQESDEEAFVRAFKRARGK